MLAMMARTWESIMGTLPWESLDYKTISILALNFGINAGIQHSDIDEKKYKICSRVVTLMVWW